MKTPSKKLSSFEELKNIYHAEEVKKNNNIDIENLRKDLIAYVNENKIFFDLDKTIYYINNKIKKLSSLKRYKAQLEETVNTKDKDKLEKLEALRQDLFEIISENNIYVGKEMLQKIAYANSKRELKYLAYQVKEKYNLSLENLESTHKSLYAILTPMGNQMR